MTPERIHAGDERAEGRLREEMDVPRLDDDAFRLLVESVDEYAIFMLDPTGRIPTWNLGAERIKGWSRDEIIGQHFSRFFLPEDQRNRRPERLLEEATAKGKALDEGWRLRKDGTRFWASVVITALRDAKSGRLYGYGKVTRDRTAQHRAEEESQLLIEGVQDYAIFRLDPEGRVASWNTGAELINGYRAPEIIGHHFSKFYPAEDVQRGKPERELALARETGRYEEEGWRVRKDGSQYWARVVVTALYDAEGALRGFAKVTRDITIQKREEDALKRLLAEQAARSAAEQARRLAEDAFDRAERLQMLTSAFSEATTREQVVQAVIEQGMGLLGAFSCILYVVSKDGRCAEMLDAQGITEETRQRFARIPLDAPLPAADSIRSGKTLYFATKQALFDAYPDLPQRQKTPVQSVLVEPLIVSGKPIGSLAFSWDTVTELDVHTRAGGSGRSR